jgi:tetratricopeptide (TPR) repeat protein
MDHTSGATNLPVGRTVRRVDWILIAILAVAAAYRVGYYSEIADDPQFLQPGFDGLFHHHWAKGLATGDWSPPPDEVDPGIRTSPYFRPPGYPYLLSAIYRVLGAHPSSGAKVQMVLGLVNCLLGYALGRRLFGRAVGLAAAALMGVYWGLIYFERELLDATVLVTLGPCLMLCLLAWSRRMGWMWAVAAGAVLGAYALVRPNVLLFALVAAAWMIWVGSRERRGWRAAGASGVLLVALALTLLPATVRNYRVSGTFVLISSNGGVNLYVGNNPTADGVAPAIPEIEDLIGREGWTCFHQPMIVAGVERALGRPVTDAEASRYFARRAWTYIREHPARTAWVTLRKALYFWGPAEVSSNTGLHYDREISRVLRASPSFTTVLAVALLGAVWGLLSPRRRAHAKGDPFVSDVAKPDALGSRPPHDGSAIAVAEGHDRGLYGVVLTALFVLVYFLSFLPFFVAARYRIPLVPFLCVAAGYGIIRIAEELRRRRFAQATTAAAAAVAVSVALATPWLHYQPDLAAWHSQRGWSLTKLGEWERAAEEYRLASKSHGHQPRVDIDWAKCAWKAGRVQEAEEILRKLLVEYPSSSDVHQVYGSLAAELGDTEGALAYLRESVRLEPDNVTARHNLGVQLHALHRPGEAAEEFSLLVELRPDNPEFLLAWGLALHDAGREEDAKGAFRRALRIRPDLAAALVERGITVRLGGAGAPDEGAPADAGAKPAGPESPADDEDAKALRKAERLAAIGKHREAADQYREVLERHPDDLAVRYHLAGCLAELGRSEDALAEYRGILDARPDAGVVYIAMGLIYTSIGDAHLAAEHFERATRLLPDSLEAHYNLGNALSHLQRYEEALQAFLRAEELLNETHRADLRERIRDRAARCRRELQPGDSAVAP